MSKPNPLTARAGASRLFSVTVVQKGLLRHVATLQDRHEAGFDGLQFKAFTGDGALRSAWAHAARIVERDATFDYRGYSVV